MKKIIMTCLGILLFLIIAIVLLLLTRKWWQKYIVSTNLIFDQEYNTVFDEISIDSRIGNIEIKEGNDSKVKLVIYGDEEPGIDVKDNKLSITTTQKKCTLFCLNVRIFKIELYLPKNYSKKINITDNFGDISIGDFSRVNLEVKSNAGNVTITSVNNLNAKLDYGDIEVGNINEYFDIKDSFGNIQIDSINIEKNSNIHSNLGDIRIGTTNEVKIEAKTSLGSVKINNNYENSNTILKVTNGCGDIRVHN